MKKISVDSSPNFQFVDVDIRRFLFILGGLLVIAVVPFLTMFLLGFAFNMEPLPLLIITWAVGVVIDFTIVFIVFVLNLVYDELFN